MKVNIYLSFIAAFLFSQVAGGPVKVLHNDELKLDDAVRFLLLNVQEIMRSGCAPLGITVLAPFHFDHYEFNSNNSLSNATVRVDNFYINGLDDAHLLALDYNNTTGRFHLDIVFHKIQVFGEYNLSSYVSFHDFPYELSGGGLINTKFSDLRFVVEFVLAPANGDSKGLRISDFDFKFYLGDAEIKNYSKSWDFALNNFVNKFASEGILVWSQQVQKRINGYFADYLLKGANEAIATRTEKDIIEEISSIIIILSICAED